jgi:hypothetical protein
MTLEAPWPLLGAGYYMKKLVAYLNNIQRKKFFYIQTLTKLPVLTVFHFMLDPDPNPDTLPKCFAVPVSLRKKVALLGF